MEKKLLPILSLLRFNFRSSSVFNLILVLALSLFCVHNSSAQDKTNNRRVLETNAQRIKIEESFQKKVKVKKQVETPFIQPVIENEEEQLKMLQKASANAALLDKANNSDASMAAMACDGAYCVPTITTSVFPIVNVTFAGINNSTATGVGAGVSPAFQAFCDTANVDQGSSYAINIQAHTSNTGLFAEILFVDWNQNNIYGDVADEIYGLGAMPASNGTDGATLTANVTVPAGAPLGTTRMRLMHYYLASNPGCRTASYGQFEDYNVTISAPTPPSNDTCSGAISIIASVDATCSATTGSTQNATDNNEAGDCTAGTETAVWYSFVATSTSHDVTVDGATGFDAVIGANNSCGSGSRPTGGNCTDNTLAGDIETLNLTGLTIGNTYYVQIYDYYGLLVNNAFDICVTTPGGGGGGSGCVPETQSDETFMYFDDVEFIGTLNDVTNLNNGYSSAVGATGYQDWTALTNSVQAQGEGVNVFVETVGGRGRMKAWVDWDQDNAFDTSEEVFDSDGVGTSSTTFGFVIPAAQALGDYTIRIRLYNSFSGPNEYFGYDYDSCEDINTNSGYTEYGETEDYTFTVIESCGAIIEDVTEGATCGDGTVDLEAVGSMGTILYHWYANETDTTPIASTPLSNWTTPSLTASQSYYVTADNGTCESLVRTRVRAIIMPTTVLTFTPSVPEVCGEDDFIELSASASSEVAYLIDENFEANGTVGLGVFSNNNIVNNGGAENGVTNWTRRESTFIPSEQVWFPAISSGFGTNKFVMATSDYGSTNITENALESASLDTSTFTDLTLNFDMYFSRYLVDVTIPENVSIEVSTDGGTNWTTEQFYDDDVGYGTAFASISLDLSAYVDETDLRIRFRYFANYWCDGVAIDNVQFFGTRPLTSSFTWSGSASTIDAYTDAAATIPYVPGTTASTVYIKPNTAQLQSPSFSFTATATLSNGCSVSENVSINNRTKFWTGSSSTNWNDANNWLPAGVPDSNTCVIIPDDCIISGSGYDAYARNLKVKPTGNLELQSDNTVTVTEWVHVNTGGVFDIRDSASLVQIDNDVNLGDVRIQRDTQPIYRYDYTYWSSPLTTASSYKLLDLSPDTLGDKFFSWQSTVANGSGNWILESAASTDMVNGTGYAIRAPQTYSTDQSVKAVYTATFTGVPANGDVNIPIAIGTDANIGTYYGDTVVGADDDQWHLIGNPYASAVDLVAFLNTNSALLDGTAYLWTHNSAPDESYADPFYADFGANYTGSDYATVNTLGATATAATGGSAPTRYIASGQSFFVMGLANGTATFDNTMRVSGNNDSFMRTTEGASSMTNLEIEKHRLWLNLSNDEGSFSQILVGYAEGATLEWDRGLDGLANGGNFVSFYTTSPDGNLAIQGRPLPFSDEDVVPLGFKATVANTYRIGVDHLDDLFNEQDLYLRDNDTGFIHDLKSAPYIFTSEVGTFDERFDLIYKNPNLLSVEEYEINDNSVKVINNETLDVVSTTKNIKTVVVYDILGRVLQNYTNVNNKTLPLTGIQKANRVLLVEITLEDNAKIYKKPIY